MEKHAQGLTPTQQAEDQRTPRSHTHINHRDSPFTQRPHADQTARDRHSTGSVETSPGPRGVITQEPAAFWPRRARAHLSPPAAASRGMLQGTQYPTGVY